MKYCTNCGRQIHEATIFCPYCGARGGRGGESYRGGNQYGGAGNQYGGAGNQYGGGGNQYQNANAQNPFETPKPEPTFKGKFHVGWFFLGMVVPVVGLILFLVWRKSEPGKARSAGIGAIVGAALSIIIEILLCVFVPGYFESAYGEIFSIYSGYFDGLTGGESSGGSVTPGTGTPSSPDSTSFLSP